jgi:Cft2 family RNA processing exonuclease
MARRRSTPPAAEPVTWRDGVHVTGTAIWCDARRARDVCFASAADRVGRAGHGQLIATAATLAQLGALEAGHGGAHLSVPYRRPFTLGTVRLELIPTGHALGAAALLVEAGEQRVLYAGVVGANGGLGELPELRRCDTLVVGAPYGRPEHDFTPRDEAADQAVAFAQQTTAAGAAAVLLVSSPAKGLDVAARLAAEGIEAAAHRAIMLAAQRLRTAGVAAPAVKKPAARPGPLLWLDSERGRLDAVLAATPRRIALVSGRAVEPGAVAAAGADLGIDWSNTADRGELLAYIQGSGARRVYLTGRCAEVVAAELGERARVLGPPRQMPLFAAAQAP